MKTPLSYYGGKQQLAKIIISVIPEHRIYCEPFCGGAAVFFAKEPSPVEILNDTNGELVNFYEVMQHDFTSLEKEVSISLHSRMLHKHARVIYDNPDLFDKIKRAWAIWMLANGSYGHSFIAGFGYDRTGGTSKKLDNKRSDFSIDYAIRLQRVQIECYDAVRIIDSRDTPESFFYCDPPYVNSDQGHYDGYTQDDFDTLLKTLERIKGRFLLSSFRNKNLDEFSKRNEWQTQEFKMSSSMTNRYESTKRNKIEVLTANYPINIDIL